MANHSLSFLLRFSSMISIFPLFCTPSYAQSSFSQSPTLYPSNPIIQISTSMHTAPINDIDIDLRQRFVVTGSSDKTARVWDINTGKLIKVIRLPLGHGYAGKVYSVAMSPDGNFVAMGGYTGSYKNGFSVFIYYLVNDTIKYTISGIPSPITALSFSKDGKYLVAMISGDLKNGMYVYETESYKQISKDENYSGQSYSIAFDPSGRVVTTSLAGNIRLYNNKFELEKMVPAYSGNTPFKAIFSPDGKKIAVGYYNSRAIDIISGENLEHSFSPDSTNTNIHFSHVAWSTDGKLLYAAGRHHTEGENRVGIWADGGKGGYTEHKLKVATISGIASLTDKNLIICTSLPMIGILSPSGEFVWRNQAEINDFSTMMDGEEIKISENGDTIQFSCENLPKKHIMLSTKTWEIILSDSVDSSLADPIKNIPGLNVILWGDKSRLILNGTPIMLDKFENSRCFAVSPDKRQFLVGTDWFLRLFDHNGNELWKTPAPSTVWSVNISGDGQVAVAAFGDGTIRWYRMYDNRELLAFFLHRDKTRWVAWTQEGFYNASAEAENLIGFHINNGAESTPAFFSASRFRKQFYRPEIVSQIIDNRSIRKAIQIADKNRGVKTITKRIKNILPPTIKILSPVGSLREDRDRLGISYLAESSTGQINEIKVRVNGRPAIILKQSTHSQKANIYIQQGQIEIEIPVVEATIDVIATNIHGSSDPATLQTFWKGTDENLNPNLYVLAVGVSDYNIEKLNLKYASKDATDFIQAIKEQRGGIYDKVHFKLYVSTDKKNEPTRENILNGFEWLMNNTTNEDVAMVFLSGHGLENKEGDYNFLPKDVDTSRLYRTAIDKYDLRKYLGGIHAKIYLFFDSCHSGGVEVFTNRKSMLNQYFVKLANELSDVETGVIVFCSSSGNRESYERSEFNNGIFTEALLEGLSGRANYFKDEYVSVAELELYLHERVVELSNGNQTPVSAKPQAVSNYNIVKVLQTTTGERYER